MKEAALIYPHQLFEKNPLLVQDRLIILTQDPRFFTDFTFHKQKIMLHRASMRCYADWLKKKKYTVIYLENSESKNPFKRLKKEKIEQIHLIDPTDHTLHAKIKKQSKGFQLIWHETPMFLTPIDWIENYFDGKKTFRMQGFYTAQRKRLNILVTKTGKPVDGAWSFDEENRKPLPDDIKIPDISIPKQNRYIKEARAYVEKNFTKGYGSTDEFIYPVTFADAKKWFNNFLKKRFKNFGTYEDAMHEEEPFLFHSILSPLLNIGLLTPDYVIEKALAYAKKHKITINNTEGFIRQIIGWREFVRAVYLLADKQERRNYFLNRSSIPKSFWKGNTGLEPADSVIESVLTYAYAHHIERLMILGNIMLLCQFHPDKVYSWFMELFIDAYDWVMVPNVYGMALYADGGLITTKPYIASSNYILKMSNYKKGEWCDIWDALFWNFIAKKSKKLKSITRMGLIMKNFAKKSKPEISAYQKTARAFLKKL